MLRIAFVLLALVLPGAARAQPTAAPAIAKLAVVSLIGDEMTVNVYRGRTGTSVETKPITVIPIAMPDFDHAAMAAVQEAVARARPATVVHTLKVPKAGSAFDPASVVVDGKVAATHPLLAALRNDGYSHLIAVAKLRAPARLHLVKGRTGAGMLQGVGFFVDNELRTLDVQTYERGKGFVAPYVYAQIWLVDAASASVVAERSVTESAPVTAGHNPEGLDAWGALTPEEKVGAIDRLIRRGIGEAVDALLAGR